MVRKHLKFRLHLGAGVIMRSWRLRVILQLKVETKQVFKAECRIESILSANYTVCAAVNM